MNQSHRKKMDLLFSFEDNYPCQTVKKWRLREHSKMRFKTFPVVFIWCKFAVKYQKYFDRVETKYIKTRQKLNLVFFVN